MCQPCLPRAYHSACSSLCVSVGHTIILDDGASQDSTHYTAAQLREVRWSQTGFITQEVSWNEQRLQLNAIRTSLGECTRRRHALAGDSRIRPPWPWPFALHNLIDGIA